MSTITVQIPEIILEVHQQQVETIKEVVQMGLVIWEYLSGHLSIQECGDILNIGYRGFLELLWSKGIPIDGLNEEELALQMSQLRKIVEVQQ
jgi:predicted HTH domain antitoxin